MTIDDQLKLIKRGAAEIISEEELRLRLEDAAKNKRSLVVKAGFDPTAPDIHLGHTVLLRKLRDFQDCGHKVIFLIGDATALVGDPSGQSKTRKTMTWEEVEANAKTYLNQVGKILKTEEKNCFELIFNSDWFSRHGAREKEFPPFTFEQFVELAKRYTVARLLERDDFQKRLKENKPISFLELFYPLMQGYDSVEIAKRFGSCDVEIGGTDQKFNMLVGRDLQTAYNSEGIPVAGHEKMPQVVITMPLLEGTDGVNKMSKSLGNYIGINDPPKDMFGKIMSISDALMYRYYELLTDEDMAAVKKLHPKEAKLMLASSIVRDYHGTDAAFVARREFENVFSQGRTPEGIPLEILSLPEMAAPTASNIVFVLINQKKFSLHTGNNSKNEICRLMRQGSFKVDGQKITDPNTLLEVGRELHLQFGNRSFVNVKIS